MGADSPSQGLVYRVDFSGRIHALLNFFVILYSNLYEVTIAIVQSTRPAAQDYRLMYKNHIAVQNNGIYVAALGKIIFACLQ